ncbi:monovalent cation/H+ antiporter subunit D [Ramlibacter sp. AW1]|uniref:Monovalent cation/H+ antiporter subunit D n=1 Tax=Ramlibacter aurantiacus TaxID=2801330 RepID=A0A937D784_9BURK|nr:monovalent cation/H+ antiporter subunit D [Ramlibacter aurantiacus]MBL0420666.1 monovalent cation/H+ antiporter subunit D [Ramlibacter aurantiacus]
MNPGLSPHLVIAPVLLPLVFAAVLLGIRERSHGLKFALSLLSVLLQGAVALALLVQTQDATQVYLAANWPAPFGIALVADRLSAAMLALTALLGGCVLLYAMQGWSRIGVHFHSLLQFLLMGLNGAFLTHDLFNLFVFFEVSLAASYGLVLHGYTAQRVRAGMQYITINLAASLLFLIGVALIYASVGTLNFADVAARLPQAGEAAGTLARIGAVTLCIVFLVKAAAWPLGFWLPATYTSASPPAAAMLVLLTKVGAYAVLRLWPMLFPGESGFGLPLLTALGLLTVAFAAVGMLSSDSPGRLGGYGAIMSSGIVVTAVGYGSPALLAAALYYLLSSILAVSAFMLLIELIERVRSPAAAVVALTTEAFAVEEAPDQPVGEGIPGGLAFLGLAFAGCAIVMAGIPPLSGFVGKFALLHGVVAHRNTGMNWLDGAVIALVLWGGMAAIISLMRFGVRTFWAAGAIKAPPMRASEVAPIALLLGAGIVLMVWAQPVLRFLDGAAAELHRPAGHAQRVLGEPPVSSTPQPLHEGR